MKLQLILVLSVLSTALLTGCPEEQKNAAPSSPSASVSAVAAPTATPATASATAVAIADASTDAPPVDAGKVVDAGKTDSGAPKK